MAHSSSIHHLDDLWSSRWMEGKGARPLHGVGRGDRAESCWVVIVLLLLELNGEEERCLESELAGIVLETEETMVDGTGKCEENLIPGSLGRLQLLLCTEGVGVGTPGPLPHPTMWPPSRFPVPWRGKRTRSGEREGCCCWYAVGHCEKQG